MVLNTLFVLICGILYYFILPFIIFFCVKNTKLKNILMAIYLIIFLMVLFVGVFSTISINWENISFVFDFSHGWCSKSINLALKNLQLFNNKKPFYVKIILLIIVGLMSGLLIEGLQFVLPVQRSVQLSDVLLNTISVLLGGVFYNIISAYPKYYNTK